MQATKENVRAVLEDLRLRNPKGRVNWTGMMRAISTAGIVVDNWLTQVRNVLQSMINEGLFKRVPDVHNEEYECSWDTGRDGELIVFRDLIHPKNLTKQVGFVLNMIGSYAVAKPQDEEFIPGDDIDEIYNQMDYEFPEETENLMILGDDSWGGVIGAYVKEGHLILIANYGDEGNYRYSLTEVEGANLIELDHIGTVRLLSDLIKTSLPA
jgi:hypothetical protein